MDPMIEEFCRVRTPQDIRPDVLRRWQAYLRDVIAPQLAAAATPAPVPVPVARRRPGREATA